MSVRLDFLLLIATLFVHSLFSLSDAKCFNIMVIYTWQEDGRGEGSSTSFLFTFIIGASSRTHLMRHQIKYVSLIPSSAIFKHRNIKEQITRYRLLKHV